MQASTETDEGVFDLRLNVHLIFFFLVGEGELMGWFKWVGELLRWFEMEG